MPLEEEKHQGLVLRSIDFRDRQKILTLFTPSRGMVSLIVKGINRKKSHLLTLTSPLTQGEYLFRIGRSELYTFCDGTPYKTHNELRASLEHIEAASRMAQALLKSQLPEKPAPKLYALILTYLKILPAFDSPASLVASFLLKLLKHEGLLSLDHPQGGFSSHEWQTAITLTELREVQTLKETPISPSFAKKVEALLSIQCEM